MTIDGYSELYALRRSGQRPEQAVLLTDSDVIASYWRELTGDRVYLRVTDEYPRPCTVLQIRGEQPHNLVALRGLHVLAMLTRKASLPWIDRIHEAKPGDVFVETGRACYALAEAASEAAVLALLEEEACA